MRPPRGTCPGRLLTSPANLISLLRLALVPAFLARTYAGLAGGGASQLAWALVLFGLICGTDLADGPLARCLGRASRAGAWLDLSADLVFLVSTYVLLAVTGAAPAWVTAVVLLKFCDYVVTSLLMNARGADGPFFHDPLGRAAVVTYFAVIGLVIASGLWGFRPADGQELQVAYWALLAISLGSSAHRIGCVVAAGSGGRRAPADRGPDRARPSVPRGAG